MPVEAPNLFAEVNNSVVQPLPESSGTVLQGPPPSEVIPCFQYVAERIARDIARTLEDAALAQSK